MRGIRCGLGVALGHRIIIRFLTTSELHVLLRISPLYSPGRGDLQSSKLFSVRTSMLSASTPFRWLPGSFGAAHHQSGLVEPIDLFLLRHVPVLSVSILRFPLFVEAEGAAAPKTQKTESCDSSSRRADDNDGNA